MKRTTVVIACLLLSACSEQQVNQAGSQVANAIASAAPQLAQGARDIAIDGRIEAAFLKIDSSSALHVGISSKDGNVTLSGSVKSAEVERRFIAAARATPEVRRVVAKLLIDPALPSTKGQAQDFELESLVHGRLVSQVGINAFAVTVSAANGIVTLGGSVPTEALHSTVLATVEKTSGVKGIVDHLRIHA